MKDSAAAWLRAILGPDGFGELRGKRNGPQDFFDLADDHATEEMAARAVERSQTGEIWVGLNPRIKRAGGNENVAWSHCLFLDCDSPESLAAVEAFPLKPSWEIRSGSTTNGFEHRQFGYLLTSRITRDRATELENRLVSHLLGDEGWTRSGDGVVRVPGTLNWKTTPPRPVELAYFQPECRYAPEQFEELLPELVEEEIKAVPSVKAEEEIVMVRGRNETPLEETIRHLKEGRGRGRNERVYAVFLRRELEAGKTEAEMLAEEDRVTKAVNEATPHRDHEYNEGKDKGEFGCSVRSRIESELKQRQVEGLAEIIGASQRIRLTDAERRNLNVYLQESEKRCDLSVSVPDREAGIRSATSRMTVERSRRKFFEVGLLIQVEESSGGKAAIYRLQLPSPSFYLQPPLHALDGNTFSKQEIALQSRFSSSFAFCGLSLQTFSALICLDRFITDHELADLLRVHPKTARSHLDHLARFGLAVRFGRTFKALSANIADKLRKAARVLGTAWICQRRKRQYRAESANFCQSRKRLSIHRKIEKVMAKMSASKPAFRPFLRASISELHQQAIDLLVAPRPPTRAAA